MKSPTYEPLKRLLGNLDYTQHLCRLSAIIGAAVDVGYLKDARDAVAQGVACPTQTALMVLLDCVDFENGAAGPFELVASILPEEVLKKAQAAVIEEDRL